MHSFIIVHKTTHHSLFDDLFYFRQACRCSSFQCFKGEAGWLQTYTIIEAMSATYWTLSLHEACHTAFQLCNDKLLYIQDCNIADCLVFWLKFYRHFLLPPYMLHVRSISPPWFDHPNNNWWRIQIMKLLITSSSSGLKILYWINSKILLNYILTLRGETKFHTHT